MSGIYLKPAVPPTKQKSSPFSKIKEAKVFITSATCQYKFRLNRFCRFRGNPEQNDRIDRQNWNKIICFLYVPYAFSYGWS